jgi:large subunit ribosomal protein L15
MTDVQPETGETAQPRRAGGLKIHHLRPAPGAHQPRTRVGRGEASKGKTAGRGTKGTKARDTVRESYQGGQSPLHRQIPKLRGFRNPFRTQYQVVNLDRIAELFPSGGDVTPADLVSRGAVRDESPIKVLGSGDLSVAVQVTAHAFSASAKRKIAAAGGTATELSAVRR